MTQFKRTIGRIVFFSQMMLLWERLWPKLLLPIVIITLFLTVSWFGLWLVLPFWLRIIFLIGFAGVLALSLWRLRKTVWPSRKAALKRIEQESNLPLRPLANLEDRPVALGKNPHSQNTSALWQTQQQRLLKALPKLRAGQAKPNTHDVDPYTLRALAVLLFVVAFFYAGEERLRRTLAIFNTQTVENTLVARLDGWVIPPDYTSLPVMFLTNTKQTTNHTLKVPSQSIVRIQTAAQRPVTVVFEQSGIEKEIEPVAEKTANSETASGNLNDDGATPHSLKSYEITLLEDARITVDGVGDNQYAWQFSVTPDAVPQIFLDGDPKVATSGALELNYTLKDDYGIISAQASFALNTPLPGTARPLYEAPAFDLSLPRARVQDGTGHTIKNLTEHPWSGLEVQLKLAAQDEADQEAWSEPYVLTLPQRFFQKPLARALVEQRQKLALDATKAPNILAALEAILFAPEIFMDDFSTFLAIDTARQRLITGGDDDALRDVAELLWQAALAIEEGELSNTERALRQAQAALREALENNASDEEIAKRVEELRQAMNDYLEALARTAENNPQNLPSTQFQLVTPEDLNQLLDNIDNLAQSGSRDAARELLSQMERMLENLQNGVPQFSEQQSDMQNMLDDLNSLMQQQRELMEDTFRQQQQQQQNSQQGEQGQLSDTERDEVMQNLQQGQSDLHEGLQQFMQDMQDSDLPPGRSLGQADRSMGEAADALGQGNTADALRGQSDALQGLREGLQDMLQQFTEQQGQPNGQQQAGQQQGNRSGLDPLGRPQQNGRRQIDSSDIEVPETIDIQRAREILNAIRQKLNKQNRPKIELDYLERLLRLD